jgi:hypothetical protein
MPWSLVTPTKSATNVVFDAHALQKKKKKKKGLTTLEIEAL